MKYQAEQTKQSFSARGFSLQNLRGILLPFTTPFDKSGEVDLDALGSNIEKWNETGIQGYVALGSTGERVHLSERECLAVIETARLGVPDSLAFIVGAGQQSTRETIREIAEVAHAGARAVLVSTPNYYRAEMTQTALMDYYRAVADASPVPLILYNVPQLTGISLTPDSVAQLAAHENIVGIKDSSGDIVSLCEMLRLVPVDFHVLTGNGAATMAALVSGAHGAILAVGCMAPRAAVELYRACQAEEHERARNLQQRLALLVRAIMGRYGIGGIKAAMDALGYTGGQVRAPIRSTDDEARRQIARILVESGLVDQELRSVDRDRTLGAGIK